MTSQFSPKTILILFLIGVCLLVAKSFMSEFLSEKTPIKDVVVQKSVTPQDEAEKNINLGLAPPLTKSGKRVSKKSFGLFISPKNSPVQPEKFQGYHTGSDFEIFAGEETSEVVVRAVCEGNLLLKESATGYGGVVVQSCNLNTEPTTVIYGHLKLSSVPKDAGDRLALGENIAVLGQAYSRETDGERKHLHLGFYMGNSVNIKGYVSTIGELKEWIDPCLYVCHN